MSDSSGEPFEDANKRWQAADDARIAAYLKLPTQPIRICGVYVPTEDGSHEYPINIASALSPCCAFFDTRADHKLWGAVARTATHFLIVDTKSFRASACSHDHIVDIKFLHDDMTPSVMRLGLFDLSEMSIYLEKSKLIQLPESPTNSDWFKAAQLFANHVAPPPAR